MTGLPPGMTQERIDREDLPWGGQEMTLKAAIRLLKDLGNIVECSEIPGVYRVNDKELTTNQIIYLAARRFGVQFPQNAT